ncbi:MAG: glycosyltransferase family 2 protein [Bacteroidetes bacterium]|nr:glycosyltransferase family 2 protein [Bacteroidota bacterium]
MNRNLKFSIIIPTYNRVEFILLAVKSALEQRYSNFEVIIVDDGSTDTTPEVVSTITDPRIRYLRIENSERGAARNAGVRIAEGDYVTFLDSDDLLYPHYLSTAAKNLNDQENIVFFHLGYEVRSFGKESIGFVHKYDGSDIYFLLKGNPLSCLGVFVRRQEALLFPFNEDRNLSGSEDWELWIRLAVNFGLKRDPRVCACLVLHDERSVVKIEEGKLIRRKMLAMKYSFKDAEVSKKFGMYWNKMDAYSDTYNSLHLMLDNQIKRSIHYLFKAFRTYPLCIFEKRTLVVLKYFVLNLFNRWFINREQS